VATEEQILRLACVHLETKFDSRTNPAKGGGLLPGAARRNSTSNCPVLDIRPTIRAAHGRNAILQDRDGSSVTLGTLGDRRRAESHHKDKNSDGYSGK
jgi:hypothetical protein